MVTETGSIDDLLTGSLSAQSTQVNEILESHEPEVEMEEPQERDIYEESESTYNEESKEHETDTPEQEKDFDDYGNEKPKPKTYSEDEVNEKINRAVRERLARINNNSNQQPTIQQQQQIQQQAPGFDYNPESSDGWQQQLEQFVEQTFSKMNQKQQSEQMARQEYEAEQEFLGKFTHGMEKFTDFHEVVGAQNISNPMALSLRGVSDPASFIYAASKRHPTELQRISQLRDPYSQMVEMGKLEERMRKQQTGTKAPRPISRSFEDAPAKFSEKNKEPSIEDLIAQSEARKMAKLKKMRGK